MANPSILDYDVPNHAYDPCTDLRRSGCVRLNGSFWLCHGGYLPWTVINRLHEVNANVHLVEIEVKDSRALTAWIIDALKKDVRDHEQGRTETLNRFDAEEAEAGTNGETYKQRSARESQRKSRLKKSRELLENLQKAAARFGITADQFDFTASLNSIHQLQSVNGVRASLYAGMAASANGTMLGTAAANSEVPAEVLADYLEDQGQDVSAVRAAFTEQPAPRPLPMPSANRSTATAEEQPIRVFSVNGRTGNRSVNSRLTDDEAANICRRLPNNFPSDLGRQHNAGRRMSASQIAWMHVLAIESQRTRETAQPEAAPVQIETPKIEAPKAAPLPAPVAPKPAPKVIVDDTLPGETAPKTPEISTEKMKWDAKTLTLSINDADTGLDGLPEILNVRSHKTGTLRKYTRKEEVFAEDSEALLCTIYMDTNETRLKISNK